MDKLDLDTSVITDYLKEHNPTKAQFCKQCDISASSLNRILNCEGVRFRSLHKIYLKSGININKLLKNEK